jgi:hypothetical protein
VGGWRNHGGEVLIMAKRREVWIPYLMSEDGLTRKAELNLGREFHHNWEITEFFTNLPKTHPWLVGAKIQFEQNHLS